MSYKRNSKNSDFPSVLAKMKTIFNNYPKTPFSIQSLKTYFPGIDIHRYLLKLEESNILMRSVIFCNNKPVTHWYLKEQSFYSQKPLRDLDNFRNLQITIPNDRSCHQEVMLNIADRRDKEIVYNNSLINDNYQESKSVNWFNNIPTIESLEAIPFSRKISSMSLEAPKIATMEESWRKKEPNRHSFKDTINSLEIGIIKRDEEAKFLHHYIQAPRRLKERPDSPEKLFDSQYSDTGMKLISTKVNSTKLNPHSPEFIPSDLKKVTIPKLLQRSYSNDTSEVNNLSTEFMTALSKNPVSVLYEFAQQRGMNCDIDVIDIAGPSHKPKISMAVKLNGRVFDTINATNKKEGKRLAADMAIRILISEGHFAERMSRSLNRSVISDSGIYNGDISSKNSVSIIDNMASLVYNELAKLLRDLSPEDGKTLAGRKVISAIIMQDEKHDTFQVVSLASGNRCISGDKISLQGKVVNDCHAEVVARRAFVVFLYHQLQYHISDSYSSLDLFDETVSQRRRFRLKSHLKFHLYISTAPCGDSALFCNRENDYKKTESEIVLSFNHEPIFEHHVQGLLRTKIEGGEGTIPVNNTRQSYQVQSLDGILRGERLRTMSCSDKIARWNYLGIQGSLLSQFIDPIFLKSISLGNLYHAGHLSRALCCRLDRNKLNHKTLLETVNHPDLGYVHVGSLQREIDKSNELSINWTHGLKLEMIDGVTGQLIGVPNHLSTCSRISKSKFFNQYMTILKSLENPQFDCDLTYKDAKLLSIEYENKKNKLYDIFHKLEYGSWVRKPSEQNHFKNVDHYY